MVNLAVKYGQLYYPVVLFLLRVEQGFEYRLTKKGKTILVERVTSWQSKTTEGADTLREAVDTWFLPVETTASKLGGAPSATNDIILMVSKTRK